MNQLFLRKSQENQERSTDTRLY